MEEHRLTWDEIAEELRKQQRENAQLRGKLSDAETLYRNWADIASYWRSLANQWKDIAGRKEEQ